MNTTIDQALIFLILVWSVIFIIFGVAMVIILFQVKKSVDKINQILSEAEDFTHGVSMTGKAAAGALKGILDLTRQNTRKKLSRK